VHSVKAPHTDSTAALHWLGIAVKLCTASALSYLSIRCASNCCVSHLFTKITPATSLRNGEIGTRPHVIVKFGLRLQMATYRKQSRPLKPLADDEIRLLALWPEREDCPYIECTTCVVKLLTVPSYEALSYCWGDVAITETIVVDGWHFQATTNLVAAIRRLRQRKTTSYLWIDAICIDQASLDEKSTQIPLMGAIYSGADMVITWLGEGDENTSAGFALAERWAAAVETALEAKPAQFATKPLTTTLDFVVNPWDKTARDGFLAVTERPYWRRAWIVQEIAFAKSRTLLCGEHEVSWDRFYTTLNVFQNLPALVSNENQVIGMDLALRLEVPRGSLFGVCLAIEQRSQKASVSQWKYERPLALLLIASALLSEASDPRDRVFGMLSLLAEFGLNLKPNYGLSIFQVNNLVVRAQIEASQRLDALAFAGVQHNRPSESQPTWVFDISKSNVPTFGLGFQEYILRRHHECCEAKWFWNASGTRNANFFNPTISTLQARGFLPDAVAKIHVAGLAFSSISEFSRRLWECLMLAKTTSSHCPYPYPWRWAFRMSVTCGDTRYGSSGGPRLFDAGFHGQTDAIITILRKAALELIRDRLIAILADAAGQLPDVLPLVGDSTTYVNQLQVAQKSDFYEEPYFWAQNTSKTQEPSVRKQCLEAFCDGPDSAAKPAWRLREYGWDVECTELKNIMEMHEHFAGTTRFFVSDRGYFGWLSNAAEIGDQICILYGCAVPLIVRKLPNGRYVVIGEAYIQGMMFGEMLNEVASGRLQEEDLVFI
jgi:hypothetical protein